MCVSTDNCPRLRGEDHNRTRNVRRQTTNKVQRMGKVLWALDSCNLSATPSVSRTLKRTPSVFVFSGLYRCSTLGDAVGSFDETNTHAASGGLLEPHLQCETHRLRYCRELLVARAFCFALTEVGYIRLGRNILSSLLELRSGPPATVRVAEDF